MRSRTALVLSLALLGPAAASQAEVLWDQIGPNHVTNGEMWESQLCEPSVSGLSAVAFDDFTLNSPAQLGTLEAVVGGYYGNADFAGVQYWQVSIWSSPANAALNLTGDVVTITVPTATSLTPIGGSYAQSIVALDLSPAALTLPPGTYYIGLAPRLDFWDYGRSAVELSGINGNGSAWQTNPGGWLGYGGNVMPLDSDFAYRLSSVPEPLSLAAAPLAAGLLLRRRRERK